ncbi:DPH4 [Candida jiufengensis]|uniref:DPH4 n=1 Tax=Candida jiufengensis TaxID=497108 RepID=UPI00222578E2|nr:DPH4 [Candida jiufengensis]KAI5951699.1 DPH4 [Candida jiufengensis]
MKSYYEILDVSSTASLEEIKTAYRMKLLENHPDKTLNPKNPQLIPVIVDAYNTLSNPCNRKEYDSKILNDGKIKGYNIDGGGLDTYSLDEFEFENELFVKSCPRCEHVNSLILSEDDLENGTSDNNGGFDIIVQCSSCSLWIQVKYYESN